MRKIEFIAFSAVPSFCGNAQKISLVSVILRAALCVVPEGHDKVSEADEGGVWIGEEADHHVSVQDGHGGLVSVQDAVLYRSVNSNHI